MFKTTCLESDDLGIRELPLILTLSHREKGLPILTFKIMNHCIFTIYERDLLFSFTQTFTHDHS